MPRGGAPVRPRPSAASTTATSVSGPPKPPDLVTSRIARPPADHARHRDSGQQLALDHQNPGGEFAEDAVGGFAAAGEERSRPASFNSSAAVRAKRAPTSPGSRVAAALEPVAAARRRRPGAAPAIRPPGAFTSATRRRARSASTWASVIGSREPIASSIGAAKGSSRGPRPPGARWRASAAARPAAPTSSARRPFAGPGERGVQVGVVPGVGDRQIAAAAGEAGGDVDRRRDAGSDQTAVFGDPTLRRNRRGHQGAADARPIRHDAQFRGDMALQPRVDLLEQQLRRGRRRRREHLLHRLTGGGLATLARRRAHREHVGPGRDGGRDVGRAARDGAAQPGGRQRHRAVERAGEIIGDDQNLQDRVQGGTSRASVIVRDYTRSRTGRPGVGDP